MTADQPETSATDPDGTADAGRWWLLPAVTFLVGVVLGALVLWVSTSSSGTPSSSSTSNPSQTSPAATVTTTVTAAATVSVPRQCLQVADDSKVVTDIVAQMVTAARDLNASKLSTLVRDLQSAQSTLQQHAGTCRDAQASIPSITTPTP